ncbi:MAG: glycosyltransferase family 9 protein [Pseudomonadota bacterium]
MTTKTKHQKILIICPHRLGDMVICTPAIKQLKDHCPDLIIDAVAFSKPAMQVLNYNPAINNLFLITDHPLKDIYDHYDGIYNLYTSSKSSVYTQGFEVNEMDRGRFYAFRLHRADMLAKFLAEHFHYKPEETKQYFIYPQAHHINLVNDLLKLNKVDSEETILIGLHLGSSRVQFVSHKWHQWANIYLNSLMSLGLKSWPIKKYIKLAKKIKRDFPKVKIILTGTENEKCMGEFFTRKVPDTINFIGKTDVQSLSVLMSKLDLYITNDTGPLHVSCATQVPVIALFRGQNKTFYPIKADHHIVIQKNKLYQISVAEVYYQTQQLLKNQVISRP